MFSIAIRRSGYLKNTVLFAKDLIFISWVRLTRGEMRRKQKNNKYLVTMEIIFQIVLWTSVMKLNWNIIILAVKTFNEIQSQWLWWHLLVRKDLMLVSYCCRRDGCAAGIGSSKSSTAITKVLGEKFRFCYSPPRHFDRYLLDNTEMNSTNWGGTPIS